MRALNASPKNIRTIFQEDKYIIPPFQRRYTWTEEECVKMFEDITDFFDSHSDDSDSYYLGNIIVYPGDGKNSWVVVDGQQRLTSLLLLLRAIFSKAQTATALEECWKRKDPLTGKIINELKVESQVIAQDKEELESIILNGVIQGKNSPLKQNYQRFIMLLDDFMSGKDSETIDRFILRTLMNVVLLPIECDSQDDALTIFNTVNNRGAPLGDADIFKAELFRSTPDPKNVKELVKRWNDLNDVNFLFRIWMHVIRAEKKETDKEIGLRKFFDKQSKLLTDWRLALDTLEGLENWNYEGEAPARIENIMGLLDEIPHVYCWYPICVFWRKNSAFRDGEAIISDDKLIELEMLLLRTLKYYFLYAVAYNSVNTIKDATYRVNTAIAHDGDYLSEYKKGHEDVYEDFKRKIKERRYGRCRSGLVSLLAILNPKQNQDKLCGLDKWDVEHILPQKGGYNAYNCWTEEQYAAEVESLGNLVMLEKPLNIRASNEFFRKKKVEYEKSAIQDARDLLAYDDWTYDTYLTRLAEREHLLLEFFKTMD